MKHQVLAVVVGSLFALPAFAMDRDVPGNYGDDTPSVSTSASKTRDGFVVAQRTGEAILETELGRSEN